MNDNFHLFEMKNNSICLDGKKINGIRAYKLEQKEGDSLAELSLEMDVRIFGNDCTTQFYSTLNKVRKTRNCRSDKLRSNFLPNRRLGSILHKLVSRKR